MPSLSPLTSSGMTFLGKGADMAKLTWYSIDRQAIGDVVLGGARLKGVGARSPRTLLSKQNPIAVGYALPRNAGQLRYQPPALFVIEDEQSSEIMSWLRVYDRQAFPLGQFSRVIGTGDLFLLDEDFDGEISRSDAWACVVLGELLAQGEYADTKLSMIPLSHAESSFSHVVAKATLLHGKERSFELCIQRLAALEADASLARKPISTRNLELIWRFLGVGLEWFNSDDELLTFIDETLRAFSRDGLDPIAWEVHKKALMSNSVETRVLAYNSVLSEVTRRFSHRDFPEIQAGLYIAAAAFLAGRGTGHYFLLRRSGVVAATASLWFGLLAGLRGRQAWDSEWTRAVKGIERQLRQSIVWSDPPTSDLGWLEYSWLAKTVAAPSSLLGVARHSARALAVEVLPGAVCQMRTAHSETKPDSQARSSSIVESELRAALEQFLALSERTKRVLGKTLTPTTLGETKAENEYVQPEQKSLLGPSKPKRSAKKNSQ